MTDAPRNMPNGRHQPHSQPQPPDLSSDQAIENAALAGAAAVQRLVAERNALRGRLAGQQRELAALRAVNDDLRRRLIFIHQHYVGLAKRVVGELEHLDGTIRDVAQEAYDVHEEKAPVEERTQPESLAQRLAEADALESASPNGSAEAKA